MLAAGGLVLLVLLTSGEGTPPGPSASELSGLELWRERFRAHSLLRRQRPDEAAAIFSQLVGPDPDTHWRCSMLTAATQEIRRLDSLTRRAFSSDQFPFSPSGGESTDGPEREARCEREFPFIDSSSLLEAGRMALRQGRGGAAIHWYRQAAAVTPVTEPEFLQLLLALFSVSERDAPPAAEARALLEDLTGRSWWSIDSLQASYDAVQTIYEHPTTQRVEAAGRLLLSECPDGRLALAVLTRNAYRERSSGHAREAVLVDLAAASNDALDTAALLTRAGLISLQLDDDRSRAIELLMAARRSAPPSPLQSEVVADLILLLAQSGQHDGLLVRVVREEMQQPPAARRQMLGPLRRVFEELALGARAAVIRELTVVVRASLPEESLPADALLALARTSDDRDEAAHWYRECLRVPRVSDPEGSEPAQLSALRELADLLFLQGSSAAAVDLLSAALALTGPPDPYRVETFAPYERWLEERLAAGHPVDEVSDDLLLLLDRGLGIGPLQEESVLQRLLRPLTDRGHRAAFGRACRRSLQASLPVPSRAGEEIEFLRRAEELASLDATLLDEALGLLGGESPPGDEALEDLLLRCHRDAGPRLALRVAVLAHREAERNGRRPAAPRGVEARRMLQDLLGEASGQAELTAVCGLLAEDREVRTRACLLQRLARIEDSPPAALVHTLVLVSEAVPPPLSPREQTSLQACLDQLAAGSLPLLPACMALDRMQAMQSVRTWFARAPDLRQRLELCERVAEVDPGEAVRLLLLLARNAHGGARADVLLTLADLGPHLTLSQSLSAFDIGSTDSSEAVRAASLSCLRAPLLGEDRLLHFLSLLQDTSPLVQAQALSRLPLLRSGDLDSFLRYLLKNPPLAEERKVVQVLRDLSAQPLAGFEEASELRKREILLGLLESSE